MVKIHRKLLFIIYRRRKNQILAKKLIVRKMLGLLN